MNHARSYMISGTASMLTATAVTFAGLTPGGLELPSAHAAVRAEASLAALASPLLSIYDTIQKANLYLFSIAEPPTTTFDRAGIIPDFLGAGFPILTQYFLNAPDYVNQAINYIFADYREYGPPLFAAVYPGALRLLTWAVEALPANIMYAAQQLSSGNLVGALETAKFAVINPIQAALFQTLNAGIYVVGGVGVRAAAVVTAIAEWIPATIRNLGEDVTVVANAAFNVLANAVYGIQSTNPQAVWNALVVGLLGSTNSVVRPTIPDALINQTIGEGGRIYSDLQEQLYIEVPSMRQNLTELRDALAEALATEVPVPDFPPFLVSQFFQSSIPTPWQPTPYFQPPPLAATVSAARSASAAEPARAVRGRGDSAAKSSSASTGRAPKHTRTAAR